MTRGTVTVRRNFCKFLPDGRWHDLRMPMWRANSSRTTKASTATCWSLRMLSSEAAVKNSGRRKIKAQSSRTVTSWFGTGGTRSP
ncbi:unnamed protein product [Symbiodinium sp. KB8]|nr:unnamed protein product [Symbiodinium sp. KB8]